MIKLKLRTKDNNGNAIREATHVEQEIIFDSAAGFLKDTYKEGIDEGERRMARQNFEICLRELNTEERARMKRIEEAHEERAANAALAAANKSNHSGKKK